jgi:hypothetical protein
MRMRVIGVAIVVGLLLASTALAATIAGSARSETLRGTGAADVIRARAGNDRAYGRNGNDRLYGQKGNDRLYGQKGNDLVVGGPGNDRLTGGPGRDVHLGGPGNDRILARDGARDVVRCGAGRDVAVVDALDRVAGCERVLRSGGRARRPAPRPGVTPSPQPVPAPTPAPAPPAAPSTTDQMLALLRGQVLTLIETNNSSPGAGFSDRSTLDLCSDGTFAYRREYSASFGGGAGDATVEEARGGWSLTDVQSLQAARIAFSNQTGESRSPQGVQPFQLPASVAVGFLPQPDGSVQTFVEQTRVFRTPSQRCG